MNVYRADDLRMLRHGVKARIAGCVIARLFGIELILNFIGQAAIFGQI
jgi:hypothetical protein